MKIDKEGYEYAKDLHLRGVISNHQMRTADYWHHKKPLRLNILAAFGLGKSTFVEAIANYANIKSFPEDFDNWYLKNNGDKAKAQHHFFNGYLKHYKESLALNESCVMDASYYPGICYMRYFFKEGMVPEIDYKTYEERFYLFNDILKTDEHYKSVVLYLPPEEVLRRIKKRNRDFERNTSLDFVIKLTNEFVDLAKEKNFEIIDVTDVEKGEIPDRIKEILEDV